jgi:hypothetical protein
LIAASMMAAGAKLKRRAAIDSVRLTGISIVQPP